MFLFERTVLAALRHPMPMMRYCDAGAIVLAREKADSRSGSVALRAILGLAGCLAHLREARRPAVRRRPASIRRAATRSPAWPMAPIPR